MSPEALSALLDRALEQQRLRPLDVAFARFLAERDARIAPALPWLAAVLSRQLADGHLCLDLDLLPALAEEQDWPADWRALAESLREGGALRVPDSPLLAANSEGEPGHAPLVLDGTRLYLRRYWNHERSVAHGILARVARAANPPEHLAAELGRLFPATAEAPDWPRIACALAARGAFGVITGGPGTGKTTTVAKLLAILVETGLQGGKAPAIRLVAPTGKAAARLTESIGAALQALDLPPEWVQAIPTEAGTLHRLLGVIPGRSQFRHHRGNPLHLDLLVVDEASMVDLPMMARLLDALPRHARLILLGDKDQLASVEAGAVLGDICSFIEQGISPAQADWLSRQTGYRLQGTPAGASVRDSLCLLSKSWRFDQHSGIGQLARACNSGDGAAVEAVWGAGFGDIRLHPWAGEAYNALIAEGVAGYGSYLKAARAGEDPAAVFKAFNGFQILCALRDGPFGVMGLNERLELALAKAGLIQRDGDWYAGRPVMVVRNDHGVGLYNGDMGLCLPDDTGRLKVWFEQPDGTLRALLPSRLPPHETVYAMTIHKSQGSEFAHTVLVLPDSPSPLLTRELVYTGITRAKARLDLYGDRALLAQAVRKKTERYSGLADRLRE